MLKFPSPYQATIFVCNKKRDPENPKGCCHDKGGEQLQKQLKAMIAERGLEGKVRAFKSGCLGVCAQGPAAMAQPSGDLLMGITPEDLPAILDDLAGDKPSD